MKQFNVAGLKFEVGVGEISMSYNQDNRLEANWTIYSKNKESKLTLRSLGSTSLSYEVFVKVKDNFISLIEGTPYIPITKWSELVNYPKADTFINNSCQSALFITKEGYISRELIVKENAELIFRVWEKQVKISTELYRSLHAGDFIQTYKNEDKPTNLLGELKVNVNIIGETAIEDFFN